MKKNNSQLIKALTVGLSAFMALSTPMTAYASETDNPPAPPAPNENATEPESTHQEALQDIQEQANDTSSAASTAIDAVDEVTTPPVTSENAGAIAEAAVATANQDAAALLTSTEATTITENLGEVKTDIQTAVTEDKKADDAAQDMVDSLDAAEKQADLIVGDVNDAAQAVAEVAAQVQNAENAGEVQDAYDKVEKIITDTTADVALKEQVFNTLTKQYTDAQAELLRAEQAYQTALSNASTDASEAKAVLDAATERAEALETAVNNASTLLDKEATAAQAISTQYNKTAVDWGKQRNLMYSIVRNYYIYQYVDPNATNITILPKTTGFDTQDNNYTEVTYQDQNGDTHSLYFNYDRANKTLSNDRYKNLGDSLDIVVFTKEREEIEADQHLAAYYKNSNFSYDTIKSMANSGQLDVFRYNNGSESVYLTRAELNAGLTAKTIVDNKNGTYTVKTTIQNEDGTITVREDLAQQVIQNQNSALHKNINTVNTQNDENFKKFIASMPTIAAEYKAYVQDVADAQDAVEAAQGEAKALQDAIDDLKDNKTNRVVKAIEVLGVKDLATYFGLEGLTSDEAAMLNKMTVNQAIKYLDERLAAAQEKVDTAKENLGKLETTKTQLGQILEDMQESVEDEAPDVADNDITPPAAGDDASADVSSGDNTVVIEDGITPTAPTIPTSTTNNANNSGNLLDSLVANNARTPIIAGAVRNILDGETPLAAQAPTQPAVQAPTTQQKVTTQQPTKTIIDEGPAKAAAPVQAQEEKNFSYWWLLIVAALAAAGEKARRKFKENKPQQ